MFVVLHPYYKLAYIKLLWGGPKEQAAKIKAGILTQKIGTMRPKR